MSDVMSVKEFLEMAAEYSKFGCEIAMYPIDNKMFTVEVSLSNVGNILRPFNYNVDAFTVEQVVMNAVSKLKQEEYYVNKKAI